MKKSVHFVGSYYTCNLNSEKRLSSEQCLSSGEHNASQERLASILSVEKLKQSRYRPGQAQRLPGS